MVTIRPIQKKDNTALKKVIHTVLSEFSADKPGTAFQDASLNDMFGHYQHQREQYFIAVNDNTIVGGAGIGILTNEPDYCELQKMYVLNEYRGLGIGNSLMKACLQFAKETGYTHCYLETFPHMNKAQELYKRRGFRYVDHRLGNTGHSACQVFMVKKLKT